MEPPPPSKKRCNHAHNTNTSEVIQTMSLISALLHALFFKKDFKSFGGTEIEGGSHFVAHSSHSEQQPKL